GDQEHTCSQRREKKEEQEETVRLGRTNTQSGDLYLQANSCHVLSNSRFIDPPPPLASTNPLAFPLHCVQRLLRLRRPRRKPRAVHRYTLLSCFAPPNRFSFHDSHTKL
ncbi:uncharacterized protein CCOS01_15941, partial [Colletotrichum costaricense]